MNSSSISVWGLVYSRVLIGSKRLSLLIALFFNNFKYKANVPFAFFLKLLLSAPKILRFETAVKKNCSMNRCFQHDDHGVLDSFVVFSTILNQISRQRQWCSITNQRLGKSPVVYVQPGLIIGD